MFHGNRAFAKLSPKTAYKADHMAKGTKGTKGT